MNELERVQQRWLDAARKQQGPPRDAVARMRRGLVSRIAAAEPPPIWQAEPMAEATPATAPVRWGPWLMGGGVLLAAATVAVWMGVRPTPELSRAADPNAAGYGVESGRHQRVSPAVQGEPVAPRVQGDESQGEAGEGGVAPGEAVPSTPASAPGAVPSRGGAASASDARRSTRSAASESDPPPAAASAPPPIARPSGMPTPAEQPAEQPGAGLDVAGEAALLNRVKVAIDAEQWSVAASRLDEYQRRYDGGVLAPEAGALDVVVDCGREAAGAPGRARRYLQRHPSSSLRERVRRACKLEP
ncbi:MAG: hypothetical protein AAF799_06870 [Myxococcota bacterium]